MAFINALPEVVKTSDTRLFADDCLLYSHIRKDKDSSDLQADLSATEDSEARWQMRFTLRNVQSHPEKCTLIRVCTNKRLRKNTSYKLHDHTLDVVDYSKYLGIPKVRVQQLHRQNPWVCHSHVQQSQLDPLSTRRYNQCRILVNKIQHNQVDIGDCNILRPNDRRTRGTYRLYQPHSVQSIYKYSTIHDQNSLPTAVTDCSSPEDFKAALTVAALPSMAAY